MVVDASALTAIMTDEADARVLAGKLQNSARRLISPLAIWETSVSVARILKIPVGEAERSVRDYLNVLAVEEIAVDAAIGRAALDAFQRYGKGRHAAGLNFGDCFAYACARQLGVPLLFKGGDFSLTDIAAA